MKSILKLALLLFCNITLAQTNLLDTSTWTIGTGSVSGFTYSGKSTENSREIGVGPHGVSVLLWKGVPNDQFPTSGGWKTDFVSIDPSKTYRFTVWIKKLNSFDGATYFKVDAKDTASANSTLKNLSGNSTSGTYMWIGDPPILDKWYLLVGYVHYTGYSITTSIGGVYDPVSGNKELNITDYKFESFTSQISHLTFLGNATNPSDTQFFYEPTIYEVNGQEPTIQELINGPDTQAPTVPTLSSASQTDATADLSWTAATDNIAVTGYKVYKDGELETTLENVLTYQVTGLTAATSYNFTVTALDAAGNESVGSNTLPITTNAALGGGSGNWTLNNQNVYYNSGNVGIGTSAPDEKLTVKGTIHSEEVKVDLSVPAPDYVFERSYALTPLKKLQKYIKTHGHLPNIPSAKEMEANGIEVGAMNMKLLEKIEELTLYILQLKKELEVQKEQIENLEKN